MDHPGTSLAPLHIEEVTDWEHASHRLRIDGHTPFDIRLRCTRQQLVVGVYVGVLAELPVEKHPGSANSSRTRCHKRRTVLARRRKQPAAECPRLARGCGH